MKKTTRVNHPPDVAPPADNRPVVAPIYQSVKYEFESVGETLRSLRGDRPGYFYMRVQNPTARQLELTLAEMQGRDDCVVSASGVNAIAQVLLALTKQGDHVIIFLENYAPTRAIVRRILARFGVDHTLLSIEDLASLESTLATRPTRLVMFESPTNPMLKIADIDRIVTLAHKHGALAVLDNTFAGFHQHGDCDVDLFVHSLTKYASGAGDVMGGAVIGRKELLDPIRTEFVLLGALLDPHAAFLIQRGLKTYYIRYREQCARAAAVAEWLEQHPAVEYVRYPGLASHPQHALARQQMQEFGTMVTLSVRGGSDAAARMADRLQLFALTASLGSTESLVMAPQMMGSKEFTPEQAARAGVTAATVRLSIGLEDLGDLLADLEQALAPP